MNYLGGKDAGFHLLLLFHDLHFPITFFCLMSSGLDPFQPRNHETKEIDWKKVDREIKE